MPRRDHIPDWAGARRATVKSLADWQAEVDRLTSERDEARKEAGWLCGLLKECATLLDNEGIPTPARQVMLARIVAALEGLGEREA